MEPQNFFQKSLIYDEWKPIIFSLLLPVVPTKSFSSSFSGHANCVLRSYYNRIRERDGYDVDMSESRAWITKGSKEEEI